MVLIYILYIVVCVPPDKPTGLCSGHDPGIVVMGIYDVKHLLRGLGLESQVRRYSR